VKTCENCSQTVGARSLICKHCKTPFKKEPEILETSQANVRTKGTWDCIHPCAIIVQLLKETGRIQNGEFRNVPETWIETLDKSGYAEHNVPEIKFAERELKRYESI